MSTIYEIYKQLEERDVILSFKGMMTSELLTTILQIMETKMDGFEESPRIRKKVFNVLVECLQNLYHHIDERKDDTEASKNEMNALFMISKSDTGYTITTGNYMNPNDVPTVKDKLDLINGMTKDELKEYYKQVLNEGTMSEKGTAGLGMIDIARKSGKDLVYSFSPINDNLTFFSLSVKIED
ncbi:SiaB family protein kinase [Crocinitomix algicola]|uniref:SiaB family protein kinase n=1 Tax=Crocinitomix algicola TaxID=1740263 RepID=UPI00082DA476|nr:SiaB family protein kinase [Crocinitomix algicola]